MKKFSIGEALQFGWNTMKANFWFFVGVVLIVVVLMVVLPGMVDGFKQHQSFTLKAVIVGVAQVIIGVVVATGLIKIALAFVDGQKPTYGDLFSRGDLFFKYLGAHILYNLIVLVGFLLLVVPGIIWGLKYQFYGYFVVEKGMSPMDAIKHSGRVTEGAKGQLFWFGIVLGLINMAGALVFGIGLLATVPTTILAIAFVYRKLSQNLEPVIVNQNPSS